MHLCPRPGVPAKGLAVCGGGTLRRRDDRLACGLCARAVWRSADCRDCRPGMQSTDVVDLMKGVLTAIQEGQDFGRARKETIKLASAKVTCNARLGECCSPLRHLDDRSCETPLREGTRLGPKPASSSSICLFGPYGSPEVLKRSGTISAYIGSGSRDRPDYLVRLL